LLDVAPLGLESRACQPNYLCITAKLPLQHLDIQPVLIGRVRVIVVLTLEGDARALNTETADVS
jgi:hypothetical protein